MPLAEVEFLAHHHDIVMCIKTHRVCGRRTVTSQRILLHPPGSMVPNPGPRQLTSTSLGPQAQRSSNYCYHQHRKFLLTHLNLQA